MTSTAAAAAAKAAVGARTVVSIQKNADGTWGRVKTGVAAAAGQAPAAAARSAAPAPAPASTVTKKHGGGDGGLLTLAKKRTGSDLQEYEYAAEHGWWAESEEEEEVLAEEDETEPWDSGNSKDKLTSTADTTWFGDDWEEEEEAWDTEVKKKKKKEKKSKRSKSQLEDVSEEWWYGSEEAGWDESSWPEAAEPMKSTKTSAASSRKTAPKQKVALNLNQLQSGVVKTKDPKTGNLYIECAPVFQACKRPAMILANENRMGARVGSLVYFKVALPDGRTPHATEVMIFGFEEVDGAEARSESSDEDVGQGGKASAAHGKKGGCTKGGRHAGKTGGKAGGKRNGVR